MRKSRSFQCEEHRASGHQREAADDRRGDEHPVGGIAVRFWKLAGQGREFTPSSLAGAVPGDDTALRGERALVTGCDGTLQRGYLRDPKHIPNAWRSRDS
jgi:hypothetical protein